MVAVDERSKRTGAYIELLGTYNPLTEPKEIKLKQDRIDYWVKQGAQMSDGFLRIIGKAKQRPPRKPKKEKKAGPVPAQLTAEEKPAEEAPVESENQIKSETSEPEGKKEEVASESTEQKEEPKNEGTA